MAIAVAGNNARRHGASGGLLRLETGTRDGHSFIRVLDRGPRFSEEARGNFFQPFWRGNASGASDQGGSGLGLAIVHAIVATHGGEASAAANKGGGALFEILLPKAG